jgi:type IV pilus assembly protein PilX
MFARHPHPRKQRGAVLLMAMFVMLILLIIGVSAARTALSAEKAARGERDRQIAFQAAEAALGDAERDIDSAVPPRGALFARGGSEGFADGCGEGERNPGLGLCRYAGPGAVPAWQRAALAEPDGGQVRTVRYGRFTGRAIPVGRGGLPARLPRYVIELMPYARAGEDAEQRAGNFYRITAIGFGVGEHTRVVLQAFYLKAGEAV